MSHVKIGPSYFVKEFNDYADWRFAFIRELMQNSIDAGSKNINLTVSKSGENTLVKFENDGFPMTEEILVDKFLSLGESGKNFDSGSVGGFGKAKLIICFAHKSYLIRTGQYEVVGSGGEYQLRRGLPEVNGVTTEVTVSGDEMAALLDAAYAYAGYAHWAGKFTVNGESVKTNLSVGEAKRVLTFGTVHTSKKKPNSLVVRINGIPMFREWINFDRAIVVELSGKSSERLTSNRDGLVSRLRAELMQFVNELLLEGSKALRLQNPVIKRFTGRLLGFSKPSQPKALDVAALIAPTVKDSAIPTEKIILGPNSTTIEISTNRDESIVEGEAVGFVEGSNRPFTFNNRVVVDSEFSIKNYTRLTIPAHFQPDSGQFSTYSQKLAKIWGRLLVQLHRTFQFEASFGIGFVFDDDTKAEFESGLGVNNTYYLNPAVIVPGSHSFRKRYKLTDRNKLLAVATHEFVHGMGKQWHDNAYAIALTDALERVLDNRRDFNWCFAE